MTRFAEETTMQINDRVTHATYGAGTIVDEHTFASGFSYSVRWDNGGPMSSSDCSWERPESLTPLQHHCICDHCRDAGTCFGCTSGLCP